MARSRYSWDSIDNDNTLIVYDKKEDRVITIPDQSSVVKSLIKLPDNSQEANKIVKAVVELNELADGKSW
jgi:hypothetical protein